MMSIDNAMQLVILNDDESQEYFKWYEFYNDHFPEILGGNKFLAVSRAGVLGAGIIVQPIVGGNSCIFSFITRNPFCDRKFSSEAVDFLIQNLGYIAKGLGYAYFISMIGEEPAKARFRKNGVKESKGLLTLFWGEC
jgi:hypothetical protein